MQKRYGALIHAMVIGVFFLMPGYLKSQNVGIDNTSPQTILHVSDFSSKDSSYITISTKGTGAATAGNRVSGIKMMHADSSTGFKLESFDMPDPQSLQARGLYIKSVNGAGAGDTRLFINRDNGNVGIGTAKPDRPFTVRGSASNDLISFKTSSEVTEWHLKLAGTNAGDLAIGETNVSDNRLYLRAGGNVGIGTASPNAALQTANEVNNRRIVLWENTNNDNQFMGFGVNTNVLRYQVDVSNASHVFYAGTSANGSRELLRITGTGNVGIGLSNPSYRLDVSGNTRLSNGYNDFNTSVDNSLGNTGIGILASSTAKLYVKSSQDNAGVFENTNSVNNSLYVIGKATITGTLSKGAGSFKIDHPLDPENKYLYHSFVESPDMMNVYNGNVTTNENGIAVVELPNWFEALNRDFRYQLTSIGQPAQSWIEQEIKKNRFVIKTDKPNVKISWQVTGIRHDPFANKNRIPVEEDKNVKEKGKYLHPESYNKPTSMRVNAVNETGARTEEH